LSPRTTCHNRATSLTRIALLALGTVLVCRTPFTTLADQIITETENFTGAHVVAFEDGQLRFRSADGELHVAWPGEISLLIVDRGTTFDDFNQAERFFASGEPNRALVRYRRAHGVSEGFWPDLITARMLLACDANGQLDKAAAHFVRLLRSRSGGLRAAARLFPENIPGQLDGKVVRAIDQLDGALRDVADEEQRVLLELLRYEILRRSGDPRAGRAAETVATLSIPETVGPERAFSILLDGMTSALKRSANVSSLDVVASLSAMDGAIRDCPEALLPGFLLLKGRTLFASASTREEVIRAAWVFLRVAIHFRSDPRAADGLLGAASALERIGRTNKAIELLEECLAHRHLTSETRRVAEPMLQRLRGSDEATD